MCILEILHLSASIKEKQQITCTVNQDIFARVLISRNFPYAKFSENKNPHKMEKSVCSLLILINHAIVANFKRRKYFFKHHFRKFSDLQ